MDENNNPIQESGVKTEAPQNAGAKKQNSMGLVSFIFSLVGLIVAAIPCGIVALITGIIGITKFNPSTEKGKGLAVAGVVVGTIDIVAGIINIVMQASLLA